MFRLLQMGRLAVCVLQEATVLWLPPLLCLVLRAPSAAALASVLPKSVSAVHQGEAKLIQLYQIHLVRYFK